ncbi:MAG: DNA polymerase III subunit gamma/tau [Bdellovibrionales bacterium]|jgi:DNA polymerase-3 subunit gamma/tau|nr:DNA polymerase III subunit gamma/tau [Bdellovibrionales bacterium]
MAQYQVIARKWRPQSFQDLIGQDHISTTLLNALRGDRLPQALLFTGVRGTGKTSTARILAKSLRCPNAKDYVPCGTCRDCEDIASSRAVDVVEIDGASNNGVDAIRELRDSVGYMPSSGRYKVYIIDEVHMLSTAAFNALLKTLEEPPAHVVFILATTEAQKIPNTILSRCQRFDFRRIPSRQIAEQLSRICEAEGVKTNQDAVWSIARQADGSMRDSQSLLDQVITFSNKEITLEKVIEVLGLTDRQLVIDGLTSLVHRNPALALELVAKVNRSGIDPKIFAQDLLEEVRNALMVRLCVDDPTRIVDLPDSEIQALAELANSTSEEDLHVLFDMMLKGVNDLLRSSDPRLVLEMTLLRISSSPSMIAIRDFFAGAQVPATQQAAPPRPAAATAQVAPPKATAPIAAPSASPGDGADDGSARKYTVDSFTRSVKPGAPKVLGTPKASSGVVTALPPLSASASGTTTRDASQPSASEAAPEPSRSKDPWLHFVYSVRKSNGLLGAMLENTHILEQTDERIAIGVPKKVSFVIDKLKDPDNVRRIEQFIETIWQKRLKVEVKPADAAAADLTPRAREERAKIERAQSIEAAIEQNPLVRTAKNVFKTQVKAIRDADTVKGGSSK